MSAPVSPFMKAPIKALLSACVVVACAFAHVGAHAQQWPAKPIRWIVPFPPGGPADTTARDIAPLLSERLGQPIVIDNRPGANSNIGFEAGARSAPDGYTMLFVVAAFVTNPQMAKLRWDPVKDFAPVAQLNQLQIMLLASAKFAPSSLRDVVSYVQANPGKLKCAWGGSILLGLGCESLKQGGKLDVTVVPYKGSAPAMNDLIGGHVDVMIEVMNTAVPQINDGHVKPIAVLNTSRGRPPFVDLPALSEVVTGFEMIPWQGIVMPAGTPPEIVQRMNREINAVTESAYMQRKYKEVGLDPVTISPTEFGKVLERDFIKYGDLIRSSNFKIE